MINVIRKQLKPIRLISLLSTIVILFSCLPFTVSVSAEEDNDANRQRVIVSLGDSYSSGEGIEDFYDQYEDKYVKTESQDWLAHRSEKSWPGQLSLDGGKTTMADHKDDGGWYFFASSGATTEHMNSSQDKPLNYYDSVIDLNPVTETKYINPQLDSLRKVAEKKKIDYVTITIGGNDAGFADVVAGGLYESVGDNVFGGISYLDSITDPVLLKIKINSIWREFYRKDGIRDRIYDVYKEIDSITKGAKIIVAGYPTLLKEDGCSLFSKEIAELINESVRQFNREIEALVNACKAEGMKICFVSVEDAFKGKEAYTKPDDGKTYIRPVEIPPKRQDLKNGLINIKSSYSMHPTEDGAKLYAECVQDKIDDIERDGGKSEWPEMSSSDERDVVLVLDTSGSMGGTPLSETKKAAERFIDTIMNVDASVGIVTYDSSAMKVSDFNKNHTHLRNTLESLNSGGQTNIEAGLKIAEEMLNKSRAKKKIIVLMSDGEPNNGKTGEALIDYADDIKSSGIYIYTLGFFSELGSYKYDAQHLMEAIASSGCHYEVDSADNLVYFFDDIAGQIQGKKYIYIRIACPVDVEVEYDGETLSSKNNSTSQRTTFGTLTFEENPEVRDDDADNRIKILRLEEGTDYDIHIEGNGKGKMNYTIGFMDDNGEYSDMREFKRIKITKKTEIDTVATKAATTVLKVDEDGDGSYDLTYKAKENSEGELVDYTYLYYIGGAVAGIILLLILVKIIKSKKAKKKAASKEKHKYVPPVYPGKESVKPTAQTPVNVSPDNEHIMFCPNCGQKALGKTFCPYCGIKFDSMK